MSQSAFTNRVAVLATMHRKEQVIVPLLERELGITVIVPPHFDTDRFGTFTRERERPGTQLEAARLKAQAALKLTGETLAIASEGTFGPHPAMPYIPCNREIILLLDLQQDLEIVGEEVSVETNYRSELIRNLEDAQQFVQQVGFPEHGVVVMTESVTDTAPTIIKGITTHTQLKEAVQTLLATSNTIRIETDMRALYNPTRMKVIEQATQALVNHAKQQCPICSSPGFAIADYQKGLPCSWCNLPTNQVRAAIYQCPKCKFRQEVLYPNGLHVADPLYCSYCNP